MRMNLWIPLLLVLAACGDDASRVDPAASPQAGIDAVDAAPPVDDAAPLALDGDVAPETDDAALTGVDDEAPAQAAASPRGGEAADGRGRPPAGTAGPVAVQPAPAAQDDIEQALRRASAAYDRVQSLRADFVMRMRNDLLKQNTTSRGTLYQRAPDRIAVRFTEPAGDVIIGDGTWFYTYWPSVDARQAMRVPAGSGDVGGVDLKAQFVGNPLERFTATLHGTEQVAGRAATVLTLVPREPAEYRSLKVWIDTRDGLARRFEIVEHNGTVRRFDLSDLQLNTSIPDATFRFTAPAGVRVVTPG